MEPGLERRTEGGGQTVLEKRNAGGKCEDGKMTFSGGRYRSAYPSHGGQPRNMQWLILKRGGVHDQVLPCLRDAVMHPFSFLQQQLHPVTYHPPLPPPVYTQASPTSWGD